MKMNGHKYIRLHNYCYLAYSGIFAFKHFTKANDEDKKKQWQNFMIEEEKKTNMITCDCLSPWLAKDKNKKKK